jgi:uncharacterized protein
MTKRRTKSGTRIDLGLRADEVHVDRASGGDELAVWIDTLRLADARGLIVGNSGAGKSRLARRLLEQAFGKIQMIVLDPEGEFPTLRSAHPFLLAGRSGEVPAEPRSAALLARRVMELGVSTVVDLYDLKPDQQREFVRNFLDALMELPKELYHPVLVVIDEAHKFCPEGGEAVSAEAVIALMSQGRKRGLGGILLTQRFAKLDKDASAEGNNVFVGRVVQDVDQKRAADVLGMPLPQARIALRDLDPGFFYAFGPAFEHKGVALFRAGTVESHHPEAGERHKAKASARPAELARLAEELKDLPQQAAEEIKTLQAAQARVRELERALKAAEKAAPAATTVKAAELVRLRKALEAAMKFIVQISGAELLAPSGGEATAAERAILQRAIESAVNAATGLLGDRLADRARALATLKRDADKLLAQLKALVSDDVTVQVAIDRQESFRVAAAPVAPVSRRAPSAPVEGLTPARQRLLDALAMLRTWGIERADRTQLAFLADASPTSSAYANNLGALRSSGLIDYESGRVLLTPAGEDTAAWPGKPLSSAELQQMVRSKLPPARWRIVEALIAAYPEGVPRPDLAARAGASDTSSAYANNLGALRSLGLIDYRPGGFVVAEPLLFLERP